MKNLFLFLLPLLTSGCGNCSMAHLHDQIGMHTSDWSESEEAKTMCSSSSDYLDLEMIAKDLEPLPTLISNNNNDTNISLMEYQQQQQ
jgi:hypothetical protein